MLWAFILTALTYFLGSAPLRAVRSQMGRGFYWITVILLCSFAFAGSYVIDGDAHNLLVWLVVSFASVAILIGLFSEFEESGLSFALSSAFSVLVMAFLTLGAAGIVFWMKGPALISKTKLFFEQSLKGAQLEIPIDQLVYQIPSVVIILWMLALYSGVLLEGRIRIGNRLPSMLRGELFQFRAPGWAVWVFIASLLPAFGGQGPQWLQIVATNILNVCVAVFFFQGLGIIHQVMIYLRVSLFWQVFLVLFLVLQLFIFVSCLGLSDYWLDLRSKLIKWRQSRLETYKRREK